ncbi:MAG: hypothetical protein IJV24_06115 [Prevotella sp.]|nr:hypothetical protein [Prevotella sp.]
MKKITFLMMAALMGLASYAQQPMQRPSLKSLMQANVTSRSIPLVGTRNASTLASDKFLSMRKAAEDYPVITEQPEGELKTYSREGDKFYVSGQSAYKGTQSGTMSIVFADNNEVYLHNIVVGYDRNTWVKGALSEDGATITVPLFQNIYYSAQYDAPVVIAMGTVDSEVIMNKVTQEVTYTVADGTITLNGTDETCILTAFWGDDESWTGYGEWNTVLTEYTPDLTLVELPEGLEEVEMPLTGKFYPSVTYYSYGISYDVEATVKVAKDGNTIYVQGLAQTMPEAWVKGELADGTVTFPVTYIGSDDSGLNYISGYSQDGPVEVTMMYDAELDAYELDGYLFVTPSETELNLNSIKGMYTGLYIGQRPALVEVPEGLETVEMPYSGTYTTDGRTMQEFNATVLVGIDGNDVYMQGLSDIAPNGWVKGSFNEDKTQVIFPFGQYVGISDDGGSVYLLGDDQELSAVGDITMSYDADADLYTLQNNLYSNGKKDEFYFFDVVLAGAMVGVPADVYVAANQGYANAEDVTEITIGKDANGVLNKADGNNAPKYYTSGTALRVYAGNTLTISSEKVIGKVEFFFDKGSKQPQHQQLEANVGSYTLDEEALLGTWLGDEHEIVFTCPNVSGNQARIQKIKVYYIDYASEEVAVPADLQADTYKLVCQYTTTENVLDEEGNPVTDEDGKNVTQEVTKDTEWQVSVAIVDNREVYIKGLSTTAPEGWVKGKMDAEGNVTVPGWYVGQYASFFGSYDLNYGGESFVYDSEKDEFTTDVYTITTSGQIFEEYLNVVITKIAEVAATPADPEFVEFAGTSGYPHVDYTIPTVGTNGEDLPGDKLSYIFYVDDENTPLVLEAGLYENLTDDMTEIPYTFSDGWDIYSTRLYLNQDIEEIKAWKKLGLQSIYRGGGEEHRSNIVWYDVEAYWQTVGISEVNTVKADNNVVYDLQGRRVAQPAKGLYIVNGKKVVLK